MCASIRKRLGCYGHANGAQKGAGHSPPKTIRQRFAVICAAALRGSQLSYLSHILVFITHCNPACHGQPGLTVLGRTQRGSMLLCDIALSEMNADSPSSRSRPPLQELRMYPHGLIKALYSSTQGTYIVSVNDGQTVQLWRARRALGRTLRVEPVANWFAPATVDMCAVTNDGQVACALLNSQIWLLRARGRKLETTSDARIPNGTNSNVPLAAMFAPRSSDGLLVALTQAGATWLWSGLNEGRLDQAPSVRLPLDNTPIHVNVIIPLPGSVDVDVPLATLNVDGTLTYWSLHKRTTGKPAWIWTRARALRSDVRDAIMCACSAADQVALGA